MVAAADDEIAYFFPSLRSSPQTSDEEKKQVKKKTLFVSYQQEIAFAKIVLWGRGA